MNAYHIPSSESPLPGQRCYIIAEAGVNHNGEPDLAVELVRAAARAGADAVKFQTFRAESLVQPATKTAPYQKRNAGADDQLSMLRKLELSPADHEKAFQECSKQGIEFLSTPFDLESARFLVRLGMRRIKVASGELTNHPFIQQLAQFRLPLIISTGMADLAEIEQAVAAIRSARGSDDLNLTILHCTSDYPARPEDANLRAIQTIRDHFHLPVGLSDHTLGILAPVAAVALGATVIEKHITLDKALPGPDHQASADPAEFATLVRAIRTTEASLGNGCKIPAARELEVRALVRRSLFAARDLPAGTALSADDVIALRPGTGISPSMLPSLINRHLRGAIAKNTILRHEDFIL
jgi:N,N'-diacetyllegionaminate synthase